MKSYKQKFEELRLQSLRTIEAGLLDENPSVRYLNSLLFFAYVAPEQLEKNLPENYEDEDSALDQEILIEDGE